MQEECLRIKNGCLIMLMKRDEEQQLWFLDWIYRFLHHRSQGWTTTYTITCCWFSMILLFFISFKILRRNGNVTFPTTFVTAAEVPVFAVSLQSLCSLLSDLSRSTADGFWFIVDCRLKFKNILLDDFTQGSCGHFWSCFLFWPFLLSCLKSTSTSLSNFNLRSCPVDPPSFSSSSS